VSWVSASVKKGELINIVFFLNYKEKPRRALGSPVGKSGITTGMLLGPFMLWLPACAVQLPLVPLWMPLAFHWV
jgi:hypothetical protein